VSWGVEDLEVRYGRTVALSGVTFSIEPGTIASVVGGDGAGKSTLLKALAGAVRPRSGRVTAPARERIGFLAGTGPVYEDLTVDENLDFVTRAYSRESGVSASERSSRSEDLLERTGLADARDRLGGQLSGGMRQKLGVVMAMLHSPDLLILDEPSTGVDPVSRAGLARLVAQAAAEGAAVISSTTYLDEASRARSVLLLDSGKQLLSGTPKEIAAATPGSVWVVTQRPSERVVWKRADGWHFWSEGGEDPGMLPEGARHVTPDLQDAVLVASIRAHPTPTGRAA
jgi:ABC-2 type transport system ATP-binding protein